MVLDAASIAVIPEFGTSEALPLWFRSVLKGG
jgi:hypothetical protein